MSYPHRWPGVRGIRLQHKAEFYDDPEAAFYWHSLLAMVGASIVVTIVLVLI